MLEIYFNNHIEDVEELEEIENIDEMDQLEYSEDDNRPIFDMVRVTKKDFSIFELYRKYKMNQLILDVSFQRNNVWVLKQKCELIESILMGLPLPIFYFKQENNATYIVVDGKQRLSTLFSFLNGDFALKSLRVLKQLNGKRFNDLKEEFAIYQSQLEDYQVYSHVILPPTPDKILFDIFDRVNRGGTKLNKQEIRNALYHGPGLEMIARITHSKEFELATKISPKGDRRMRASYLITRFLAFYLMSEGVVLSYNGIQSYDGNLDDLIEHMLTKINRLAYNQLECVEKNTKRALKLSHRVLGDGAFRRGFDAKKPINMNIFETVLYFMMKIVVGGVHISDEEIKDKMYTLIENNAFLDCIGNGRDTREKAMQRFVLVDDLYREACEK